MGKANVFLIPGVSVFLLGSWACSRPDEPLNPSLGPAFATTAACTIVWTYIGNKGLTVSPNSTNNIASWTIANNGSATVTLSSDTPVMGGSGVIAIRRVSWATFPFSLTPGSQIRADVAFDVAASGSGGVGMNVASSCGTLAAPLHTVFVQASPGGVPFGPFDLFNSSGGLRQISPFNLTVDFASPSSIIQQIDTARKYRVRFVPAMTGGNHDRYLDSTTTPPKFSFSKWKAVQSTFNTTAIKNAISAAVADGTIPFAELMDEPNHDDWGGVMNHALLDSMSRHTKSIFPTLKTGVVVQWDWQKTQVYQSVDVLVSQYGFHQDQIVERYRDSAVVSAQRQRVGLMFSMNLLGGGGTTFGSPMTATQVQNFGNVLVAHPYACGLTMWQWDNAFMANTANQAAFTSVSNTAAGRSTKTCVRP